MMTKTHKRRLYAEIASLHNAIENCRRMGNNEWLENHERSLEQLKRFLPSGSGIDNGTQIESVSDQKIVLSFGYHHMDEHGGYDGWTEHTCVVKPSLQFGIDVRITGQNRNDIKDYLHEVFQTCLSSYVYEDDDGVAKQEFV